MDVADLKILIEKEEKELETIDAERMARINTCHEVKITEINEKESPIKEDLGEL